MERFFTERQAKRILLGAYRRQLEKENAQFDRISHSQLQQIAAEDGVDIQEVDNVIAKPKKRPTLLKKVIGETMLGVAASVLIGIGFSNLIYPDLLSDTKVSQETNPIQQEYVCSAPIWPIGCLKYEAKGGGLLGGGVHYEIESGNLDPRSGRVDY